MLKHSVKLCRYMLFGDVAPCHRAACVLCTQHTRPLWHATTSPNNI